MPKEPRFWRNVTLIALAHLALIAAVIRWSVAARAEPQPESIVWLGATEAAGELKTEPSPPPKRSTPQVTETPIKDEERENERSAVTRAKSEIELPSPTPKPTPTPTPTKTPHPKPTATPTPKPKATPKPLPKPTPKKIVIAKASPKSSPETKPRPEKIKDKSEKPEKKAPVKSENQNDGATTSSTSKAAAAGGGNSASDYGWYGRMLHDRFYSAWIQPTSHVPSGSKFSTLVKVRIDKDGHVSKFEIVKPSDNPVVNESVAAVAKHVSEVDAPPTQLVRGDHYDVKINFELNTEEKTQN